MKEKYKVAYVSGTRADYGIVRKYLKLLNSDGNIDFSVLVTGAHLERRFGRTVEVIHGDGFTVGAEFPIEINNETTSGVISSMSRALSLFGEHFEKNKYDLLIVLGDRYEILAATIAAAMQKIPILHLHGGEITLGNYDEFIRHSITKMSRYHFTSTEQYRKRVIQLGESPERVFYMGSLGAENAREIDASSVDKSVLSLQRNEYFTVLYHPETLTDSDLSKEADTLLSVLSSFSDKYKVVLIGSNADTGAGIISKRFKKEAEENNRFLYYESLSPDTYLYLVKNSIALIGNSSSGIIEAPSLDTYTVNIGKRQDGRIRADSVFDVRCRKDEIKEAILKAIERKRTHSPIINPYYKENAAENYYRKTLEILLMSKETPKEFYDITPL